MMSGPPLESSLLVDFFALLVGVLLGVGDLREGMDNGMRGQDRYDERTQNVSREKRASSVCLVWR